MGLFYTNIVLYKAKQQQIADFLNKQKRNAYVSPTVGEFTVIYDKETEDQDTRVLEKFAGLLTKKFSCAALASLVHDSDIYMYWLFDKGKLIDTYNSLPGYFDSAPGIPIPEGGDGIKICATFEKLNALLEVEHIFELVKQSNLGAETHEYLSGEDIHAALVRALDMPSFVSFTGYYTLENANLPEELERISLIKCPSK
jgi:hypothetical protein